MSKGTKYFITIVYPPLLEFLFGGRKVGNGIKSFDVAPYKTYCTSERKNRHRQKRREGKKEGKVGGRERGKKELCTEKVMNICICQSSMNQVQCCFCPCSLTM